jgi:hypothetical protein
MRPAYIGGEGPVTGLGCIACSAVQWIYFVQCFPPARRVTGWASNSFGHALEKALKEGLIL